MSRGTITKRTWSTRQGETRTAWLVRYLDPIRRRISKQFPTKREAMAWLDQAREVPRTGPVVLSMEEIKRLRSALCGVYFLFLSGQLQRIGQSSDVRKRLAAHQRNGIRFDDCCILHCAPEHLLVLEGLYVERFRPPHNHELRHRQAQPTGRDLGAAP
jgi:hypothetical protein